MKNTLYAGTALTALSILLAVYLSISSYSQMLKMCKLLAFKGSALRCFYQGPLASYWIALSAIILIIFIIGISLIGTRLIRKHR